MSKKAETSLFRSQCPVAASLDLLGDKWSLIIIRDLMVRKRKYKDFQESAEGIPTNILASRLRKLEEDGIIKKRPYQERPVRHEYLLTRKGAHLLPVLQQLAIWGHHHIPGSLTPPDWFLRAKPSDMLREK